MTAPADVARWLGTREPAPASVRAAMDAALAEADRSRDASPETSLETSSRGRAFSASVSDRLAAAGLAALGRVVRSPSHREEAFTLLAADALLTYACEAAAEAGLDELDRLTAMLDFERFSELTL